ncbi:MAG: site-specific recombinase [Azoarcus sp.]|jgi:site-specific recombinase|nr:site-specific recombinase [Azoarcus sp.]
MGFGWKFFRFWQKPAPAAESRWEPLLARIAAIDPADDKIQPLIALIDAVRAHHVHDASSSAEALAGITRALPDHPAARATLCTALESLFIERKQVSLYVASGMLPQRGFFSEMARRISHRLLPDVVDTAYLKDLLAVIFHCRDDEIWVDAVDDAIWVDFFRAVLTEGDRKTEGEGEGEGKNAIEPPGNGAPPMAISELLEALRMLSYHISAIGLDPELVRVDPQLEEVESPFLAQNVEVVEYLDAYRAWWSDPSTPLESEAHLGVMLDQCKDVLHRVRSRATRRGTSLTLTLTLERLHQHLQRINKLLGLLRELHQSRAVPPLLPQAVAFFKRLVRAECRKNQVTDYWHTNVRLLSKRMTESAANTGEKYITATRREYFGMLGSAALGGVVIAIMAAFKIALSRQGMAPLTEALCFCLNYGIGFALIHTLGGTVATKQPAMTANAIAASIEETRGKARDLENLADTVVHTLRSQFAAVVGNLGLSIPMAILLSFAFAHITGYSFVDFEKADHLLADAHPLSGAPFYAAIAGVCLFLSGLIAAWYDNLTAYNRIPERLAQLRGPRRLFGEARMQRFTAYVEHNLGALAGNFFFGFLLGGATVIGVLFGLPLDIRHIAFSAAYVGYAAAAYDFTLPFTAIAIPAIGVLLIGFINLLVSFTLALYVAMRSRGINFEQGRTLIHLVLRRLALRPLNFVFPPRAEAAPAATESPSGTRNN